MKRCKWFAALFFAATLFATFASATGGTSGNPLISLDYLTNVFASTAERAAQERVDAAGEAIYRMADTQWRAGVAAAETSASAVCTQGWTETRLKQGDILSTLTGTQVLLLAGDVSAQNASGAVVDATDGVVLPSGTPLKQMHRYLVAEDTIARIA